LNAALIFRSPIAAHPLFLLQHKARASVSSQKPLKHSIETPKSVHTHTHTVTSMGTKNISISEEAYERLAAMKRPNESFTEVVNRLTRRRSILELAGTLTEKEGDEIRGEIFELRKASSRRVNSSASRVE